MSRHHPPASGPGRYSVEQPHQSGIWSVCGGRQPCGCNSAARKRIGATSRPHVQQAIVGRRWPWASSQGGGVIWRQLGHPLLRCRYGGGVVVHNQPVSITGLVNEAEPRRTTHWLAVALLREGVTPGVDGDITVDANPLFK